MPNPRAAETQYDTLQRPDAELEQAVTHVCDRDADFRTIEAEAGSLTVRRWPPGFASLVRIITGQQLSSKAARSIFQRLTQQTELTPTQLAACSEAALKQAGLSRAKIATCQQLAAAILHNRLNLEALATLPEPEIVEQLTQVKGIGIWTAEIYSLFCLHRLSSFPASDLAVQAGYALLKGLEERPTRQALLSDTESLHPYRGAVAHLLWHYYRYHSEKKAASVKRI